MSIKLKEPSSADVITRQRKGSLVRYFQSCITMSLLEYTFLQMISKKQLLGWQQEEHYTVPEGYNRH